MSKQYPGGLITKSPVTPSGPYETSTASGIWTLDQQAYWRKLNQWPIAGNPVPDAQFNYVTMLLHGDGTNGAQNNTFLDSSTNNFTITRNGNTTQGSFSPYGSNWSNYFDGTGDYLSVSYNSAFNYSSSIPFTIDIWFYPTVGGTDNAHIVACQNGGTDSNLNWLIRQTAANKLRFVTIMGSPVPNDSTDSFNLNQWNHAAIVMTGSAIKLWLNGVYQGSVSCSGSQQVNGNITIGYWTSYYTGYISNFRYTNTQVYTGTSNITVPTSPLTAVSGTQLLTCQSNRFVDNSANNFAITANGNTSVQRFNPFGASTAYSTSVIGGSGYFDGSGDYLTAPSDTAFDMGSGDFTIEGWFYRAATSASPQVITTRSGTGTDAWYIGVDGSKLEVFVGSATVYSTVGVVRIGAWYHFALERNGANLEFYLNGTRVSQVTAVTMPASTGAVLVGYQSSTYYWNGFVADFRIVKGTAVYSGSTYTIPTAPSTAISGTSLLLSTTNGAIFDNAMMNDLETVGNAQISTSVVKYGTGSLSFGSGAYLQSPLNPANGLGGGDFTIEMWVYMNNTTGAQVFYGENTDGNGPVVYSDGGTLKWYYSGAYSSGGTISTGAWTHIAACRASGTLRFFINGTQTPTSHSLSTDYPAKILRIGTSYYGETLDGYIDDLRITKGYARYTANFTPPTAAFPNIGPT